jgi:hypothetical protein
LWHQHSEVDNYIVACKTALRRDVDRRNFVHEKLKDGSPTIAS